MDLLILAAALAALILLDLAALRWGVDSIDGLDSPEWQRRQDWLVERRR